MDIFHFRGNRNYIHGTTLFDYIVNNIYSTAKKPNDIDFLMHRPTKMQCEVISAETRDINSKELIGEFICDKGKHLILATSREIKERRPYDEETLLSLSGIIGNKITVPADVKQFSAIEKIIAAYKFLLTSIFQGQYGKFLFARIKLGFIPVGEITIKHDRIISNRYFQGTISDNNNKCGTIFFGII